MIVLAVMLVLGGGLAAGYLYTGLSDREVVVIVTRDVPAGTKLGPADVATTRVAASPGVALIPGRQLSQVRGQYAAVSLRRGSLLAASQLTSVISPRPGEQLVPIAVNRAQLPARGLKSGDQVLVITTPGQQGQASSGAGDSGGLGQDSAATVDAVSNPDVDGTVRVDLLVKAGAGPAIARQASTGRVGFILTSGVSP